MSNNNEGQNFTSRDFALRAQKKIASQFASRRAAKVFISENMATLLDLLYQLLKCHTGDKKKSEKFVKNLIKLSLKVGILTQNDKFSPDEVEASNRFAEKFRTIAKTIASFVEVDFSYDQKFLLETVDQCEDQIKNLVKNHLTEKSIARISSIAVQLKDTKLLDASFTEKGSPQNQIMIKIVNEINKALENGDL